MSRVVVIGAGVGGLAAAVRLAAAGHRVTVHERADTVGGKLGRYERDGFRFDTGPSLLTLPQVFADLFAAPAAAADWPGAGPGGAARLRRRHRCWTPRPTRGVRRPASPPRSGPAPAADWDRLWRRAEPGLGRPPGGTCCNHGGPRLDLAALAWRVGDLAAIAPGPDPARPRPR